MLHVIAATLAGQDPHKVSAVGSTPTAAPYSQVAQLVEQLTVNQRVVGSSPTPGELPRNPKLRCAWGSLCSKAFLDSTQPNVGVSCSTN
jgi:hypothetical protein